MADQQRIHPNHDVESPPPQHQPIPPPSQTSPSAPLLRGASKSDQNDAVDRPIQQTLPVVIRPKRKRRHSLCCRCFCWKFSILLALIIVIAAVIGILYLVFQPKLPKYTVDKLSVSEFDLRNDSSLFAVFNVTITAENPNKKIGIYYEDGSHISGWYNDTKLCQGSLPKFYQGHENTTVLNIPLTGEITEDATGLLSSLVQTEQQTGSIPLNLKVKQPVRVKLGALKLMEVKFNVKCKLTVDDLSASNPITIQSSDCDFSFSL
ncbi:NDR1/HIN1-like protein 6 [Rutidosis leptorrhynchoides]|uniref:NDR1/HIN1-like protein 6 n=1 Tax=Rutidosis leptorrhynchoides TaxID=125765 RepID=UPI003A994FAD